MPAVLLLAAIPIAIYTCSGPRSTKSADPTALVAAQKNDRAILAWTMAEGFVKRELKSPGSADFGGLMTEYQRPAEHVVELADNHYVVSGWVDSQNAFGAKVRSTFRVRLHQLPGGDQWQLDAPVSLTER